jgi:two-component system chemotaxis response regulator CheB
MSDNGAIVVIGGSAGAIDPIQTILSGLSRELPAAVFIVVHTGPDAPGYMATMLEKRSALPVRFAKDLEPIEIGTVYIAPPDRHLLIKSGEMRTVRGPRENGFRPSVDALFRSAARSYGSQVICVILSGSLDDGTHGGLHVKEYHGVLIAQLPAEAQSSQMSEAIISRVGVDHVVRANEIASLLNKLAPGVRDDGRSANGNELDISEGKVSGLRLHGVGRPSSPFICPECDGALWEQKNGELLSYRCHTGHGFSGETLLGLQSVELEQTLWSSVRLFDEQAELQHRLASHAFGELSRRHLANALEMRAGAALIRRMLTSEEARSTLTEKREAIREEYPG